MKNKISLETFNEMTVSQAVIKNTVPAMIAMLMFLIYNLADTFFIGLTHNAYQMAAITLSAPLFLLFTAFANVFGMGGTSVIARAFGKKNQDYVKHVSAFCAWTSIGIGVLLALIFIFAARPLLLLMGASQRTLPLAEKYLCIAACAGPFTMITGTFSKLLMTDGQPKKAMTGSMFGNLINIVLDALFIIVFRWNITGIAFATLIGNVFSAAYFLLYFRNGESALSIHPKDFTVREKVCRSVLAIGIPAALGSLTMGVSSMFLNRLMAGYGDMALAGIGVAGKLTMITGMVCMGIGQGVQPLLGYCVGAEDGRRYQSLLKFSLIFAFLFSGFMTILCYIFMKPIIGLFLSEPAAFVSALHFGRILLSTSAFFGVFYVLVNTLQAMGAAFPALIVNISRQGLIYIPVLFLLHAVSGPDGLAWAQPAADILALILVSILSLKCRKSRFSGAQNSHSAYFFRNI
ncbi:MAG: MATE family efflux transporter [Eubacterium sp.]